MKKYSNDETFSEFNPEKFYAGKIDDVVVFLQRIDYCSMLYQWVECNSAHLNSYSGRGEGLKTHEIFSTFTKLIPCEFYEFETAKEMHTWLAENL